MAEKPHSLNGELYPLIQLFQWVYISFHSCLFVKLYHVRRRSQAFSKNWFLRCKLDSFETQTWLIRCKLDSFETQTWFFRCKLDSFETQTWFSRNANLILKKRELDSHETQTWFFWCKLDFQIFHSAHKGHNNKPTNGVNLKSTQGFIETVTNKQTCGVKERKDFLS